MPCARREWMIPDMKEYRSGNDKPSSADGGIPELSESVTVRPSSEPVSSQRVIDQLRSIFESLPSGHGASTEASEKPPVIDSATDEARPESKERSREGQEVPPDEGEAGTGSYDPRAAARDDHDAAVAGLREIIAALQEEVEAIRQESAEIRAMHAQALEQAERHKVGCQQLIALLDEMLQRGPGQGPDLGWQAASTAKALKEETRRERKKLPGRVWDRIWDELKRVLPRIWSMISHLLTVKEWTISGQAGTVFGLAQVGISITFG